MFVKSKSRKCGFLQSIRWDVFVEIFVAPVIVKWAILNLVILSICGLAFAGSKGIQGINDFVDKRNKEKQDAIVYDIVQEQLKIEKENEKQKEIEEAQKRAEERKKETEKLRKKYPKGTRIKCYDGNCFVNCGDNVRYSIGAIDTVDEVIDDGIIKGSSGEIWAIEFVGKVESNREWRDLIDMKHKGQLKFVGEE